MNKAEREKIENGLLKATGYFGSTKRYIEEHNQLLTDYKALQDKVDKIREMISGQLTFCEIDAAGHKMCGIQVQFYKNCLKEIGE